MGGYNVARCTLAKGETTRSGALCSTTPTRKVVWLVSRLVAAAPHDSTVIVARALTGREWLTAIA